MSKIKKVFIRSIPSIEMKKDKLYTDLFMTTHDDLNIPLVYQYAQESTSPKTVSINEDNVIGRVIAIYHDNNAVFCDVVLNDVLEKSTHFNKVIDNFTIKITKDRERTIGYEFVQFIIYNKNFKRKVDEKCVEMKKTQTTPKTKLEEMKQNHYNRI